MQTKLQNTPLSVALVLKDKNAGFEFRTKDEVGAVRGFKILSCRPLVVGQLHAPGVFREVTVIKGEFYLEGVGDGFFGIEHAQSASGAVVHNPE